MGFDNLRLEKGMYGTGRSFTQVLEGLDPFQHQNTFFQYFRPKGMATAWMRQAFFPIS